MLNKIEDNAYILYHDSERNNAKTTLKEFERLLNEYKFTFDKQIINNIPELTIYKIYKDNKWIEYFITWIIEKCTDNYKFLLIILKSLVDGFISTGGYNTNLYDI